MKLLVLSHISELVGGAEKSLLDLFDIWTKEHDINPEFILRTPVGTLGDEMKTRGWKFYEVDYTFWSESTPPTDPEAKLKKSLKNTRAILEIEKIIQKTRPDLVFTNSVVCPWAAIAAHNQGVPHAWFVREFGDLDHGRIFDIGRKKTWEDVDVLSNLVITNSQALAKHLKKYIKEAKLVTLYHPFDIPEIVKKSKVKVPSVFKSKQSLKLVLAAGSLTGSKGVAEAIEAAGRLNKKGYDTELCLIGRQDNKEYAQVMQKLIKRYKITEKVHFVGWQKNPLAYVRQADVGIMASRMEAFGRVTFEYIAIGKPVLGTNSGGTPEIVVDDKNGFLYEWGDVDSLISGLEKYAKDRALIKTHGSNGEKHAKELVATGYSASDLFKDLELAARYKPRQTKKLHYESELADYAEVRKSLTNSKKLKDKLKKRTYHQYRRARTLARKAVKGY